MDQYLCYQLFVVEMFSIKRSLVVNSKEDRRKFKKGNYKILKLQRRSFEVNFRNPMKILSTN